MEPVPWSRRHPVVQVGDTAGVPELLAGASKALGVPTETFAPPPRKARAGTLRKAMTAPGRLLDARRALAGFSPSVLHVHYATAALWYLDRHPLVVHCHGTDVRGVRGARRVLVDLVCARADLVLVATPDLLGEVRPGARYLPNPVDTGLFAPVQDADTSPGELGDVLVFAALSEVKGADGLIGAIGELKRRRDGLRITVIDHGPRVADAVEAGARVVRRRAQRELPELIGGHRVVIGQQFLVALGTAELQAMACARPVVGVVDTSLYDGCGEPPPVLTARGPAATAEAVLGLLDDPAEAVDLGARARDWVSTYHAVPVVAEQLVEHYLQLDGRGRRHG
ncbi:MAG: glycosyltransferase family 4 protein [Microthrixaceae bacterium]